MMQKLLPIAITLLMLLAASPSVAAREGDTLEPIQIEAPALETFPEDLLNGDDAARIEGRVTEARNSGVPVAVRIIDMTQENQEIPFPVRQFARDDFSQPFSAERQEAIVEAWMKSERIESSEGANDGFLLLILVPEDRSQTMAIWWVGPNALPLNGLTQENILATHTVMNGQFAEGNMPNGVYLGLSEFSYNIQFGEPKRLTRSTLQNALNWSVLPLAIATASAGIAVPVLAVWLARKNDNAVAEPHTLTAWEAAALHQGRARQAIPAAMLLEAFHSGTITPRADGSLQLAPDASGPAVNVLRPYANSEGIVNQTTMYEIEAIAQPVRTEIEDTLARIGAMTKQANTDRTWMLLAMGFASFLAVLAVVPTVASMSAPGVLGIAIAIVGILAGWWWLAYRSYTSPAGVTMLAAWLENASPADRHHFDTVVYQDLLINQDSGPDVTLQNRLMRQLRGLGSG